MAAGTGTHAEGLPYIGPRSLNCAEGGLPGQATEAWIGPAGIQATSWCLGTQTGVSDQLYVS